MPYDVDREPGAWVSAQADRRARRVWLFIGLLAGIALVSVVLLKWNPAPVAISIIIISLALGVRSLANREADRAIPWLKGARAETSVGEELNELRREGFTVMHDIEQRGEGNIDHLVSGPTGVFLVETKLRRYRPPDLVKVKRQAVRLNAELGTWITPVICLHERQGRPFKTEGVWIVPRSEIRTWTRGQRNTPVPFEQLARFADGL
jgi:hypothetical protein